MVTWAVLREGKLSRAKEIPKTCLLYTYSLNVLFLVPDYPTGLLCGFRQAPNLLELQFLHLYTKEGGTQCSVGPLTL